MKQRLVIRSVLVPTSMETARAKNNIKLVKKLQCYKNVGLLQKK